MVRSQSRRLQVNRRLRASICWLSRPKRARRSSRWRLAIAALRSLSVGICFAPTRLISEHGSLKRPSTAFLDAFDHLCATRREHRCLLVSYWPLARRAFSKIKLLAAVCAQFKFLTPSKRPTAVSDSAAPRNASPRAQTRRAPGCSPSPSSSAPRRPSAQ